MLVYDWIDIEKLEESLRDSVLDCLDSVIDGVFDKSWCVNFLLVNNVRTSPIHNIFLLMDRKEIIWVISMTKAEENSCDWASFREFIESLVLQELFNIRLVLKIRRIIARETGSKMSIDEGWLVVIDALIHLNIIFVFVLFIGTRIEIFLAINWG